MLLCTWAFQRENDYVQLKTPITILIPQNKNGTQIYGAPNLAAFQCKWNNDVGSFFIMV